jgi:dCTP deaminase
MVLNDREIRALLKQGDFLLQPFDERLVQPASVDLRLGPFARVIKADSREIDLRTASPSEVYENVDIADSGYVIPPGGLLIGQSLEYMKIPATCNGMIEQRSSLMRLGIHVSSSSINPGYAGNLPLFIFNAAGRAVRVFAGVPFCQLVLLRLSGRPDVTYAEKLGAKYQEEREFFPSKISQDIHEWIAPSARLVHSEQARDFQMEVSAAEAQDDKVP